MPNLPLIYIKPVPTNDADKAAKSRQIIVNKMNAELAQLSEATDYCFNLVWRNPFGLTAQQVLDAFGTDAVKLFQFMGAVQTALNAIQAGIAPQVALLPYTINQDGTVTIT